MSAVSDHVQLAKSKETKYPPIFNKRERLYINDTTTQYDQDKFLDYNAAYLSVPILITLTNNTTAAGLATPATLRKSLGFKQSFL